MPKLKNFLASRAILAVHERGARQFNHRTHEIGELLFRCDHHLVGHAADDRRLGVELLPSVMTNGIITSGSTTTPAFWLLAAASKIARACIW